MTGESSIIMQDKSIPRVVVLIIHSVCQHLITDRPTHTYTDTQPDTRTHTHGHTQTWTLTQINTYTETHTDRHSHTDTQRQTDTLLNTHTHVTDTHSATHIQTQTRTHPHKRTDETYDERQVFHSLGGHADYNDNDNNAPCDCLSLLLSTCLCVVGVDEWVLDYISSEEVKTCCKPRFLLSSRFRPFKTSNSFDFQTMTSQQTVT